MPTWGPVTAAGGEGRRTRETQPIQHRRVTGLKARRVQDITEKEARREGCAGRADFHRVWNDCYAKPHPVKGEDGEIDHYESYFWEDIQETRTYKEKPWYVIGNPWVWVIEFQRITKEEAEHGPAQV